MDLHRILYNMEANAYLRDKLHVNASSIDDTYPRIRQTSFLTKQQHQKGPPFHLVKYTVFYHLYSISRFLEAVSGGMYADRVQRE